ncbi:hypothetical protein HY375_01385 [Candidatus Berkelbacteria bacterium]|nr:hypothetical protein [Candidatus Berkelbacteria bacterium]
MLILENQTVRHARHWMDVIGQPDWEPLAAEPDNVGTLTHEVKPMLIKLVSARTDIPECDLELGETKVSPKSRQLMITGPDRVLAHFWVLSETQHRLAMHLDMEQAEQKRRAAEWTETEATAGRELAPGIQLGGTNPRARHG